MAVVSLKIPQIGEGLQEARLVAVLKAPGDTIHRDEPIYQMETDKAVMDVESPVDGVLVSWSAEVDAILPIGGEVAQVDTSDALPDSGHADPAAPEATPATAANEPAAAGQNRLTNVPPRTRAYAKEKGITDAQLAELAASGSKLMPADIDAFLAGGASTGNAHYAEQPMAAKQRLLSSRLVRGSQLVVPGTMSIECDWTSIDAAVKANKAAGGDFQPSAFTMFAYAVAQTLKDFPMFRSSLVGEDVVRTYHHADLGIAVGLPGDVLVLAVVDAADTLSWKEFATQARAQIDVARTGKDQAKESVTISLTNMQSFHIRDAIPVVVSPAVATLFIGEVFRTLDPQSETPKTRLACNLALTFDHRLMNGVGAAEFLKALRHRVEAIETILQ